MCVRNTTVAPQINKSGPSLLQTDKFKQRAAAEVLTGLIRGAKHFPGSVSKQLWDWFTPRLPQIFAKLTLDTLTIWQSFINVGKFQSPAAEVLRLVHRPHALTVILAESSLLLTSYYRSK
jgi:hypothetical protein